MSYVAFLRGINLGKINKVDMKSLRSLFEEMGFQNVQTYIQTGNVLFTNVASHEQQIENRLKDTYGFDIPVTIRSKDELTTIQQHPLFSRENGHIIFLKEQISHEQIDFLQSIVEEDFSVVDQKTIIINLSKNYHQTKYTNTFFEKKLQISSTLRNRNTIEKILLRM